MVRGAAAAIIVASLQRRRSLQAPELLFRHLDSNRSIESLRIKEMATFVMLLGLICIQLKCFCR